MNVRLRFACLFVLILGLIAPVLAAPLAPEATRVILIVADDIGADSLSCYERGTVCSFDPIGRPCSTSADCPDNRPCVADYPSTPALCDTLADNGVLFSQVWSSPSCSPTRATIQTGRYGFRNGVLFAGESLPLEEEPLAETLGDQGFATAAIGKWHLSGASDMGEPNEPCSVWEPSPAGPNSGPHPGHGFDYFAGTASNIPSYYNWCRMVHDVEQGDPVVSRCNGAKRGRGNGSPCDEPYATKVNVDDAISWIQGRPPEKSWFVLLSFNAAHSPFDQPPDRPCSGERGCFKAIVEAMDAEIARLIEVVDPELTDTTVIFVGDNGTDDRALTPWFDGRSKGTVYEAGIGVPLIIAGKAAVNKGVVQDQALVNTTDLFATVLDLAGTSAPSGTDSISLLPYLDPSREGMVRSVAFSELSSATGAPYQQAARNDRFKLIRRLSDTTGDKKYTVSQSEFYDLANDPFETNPITDPDPAVIEPLRSFLDNVFDPCPEIGSCGNPPLVQGACTVSGRCDAIENTQMRACSSASESVVCGTVSRIHTADCGCDTQCNVLCPVCVRSTRSWICQ